MAAMKVVALCGLGLCLLTGGCKPTSPPAANGDPRAHTYAARGIVRQIAADRRSVTIQHEAIAGYMAAMTMDFSLRDTNELAGLKPGDGITFQLVVRDNDDWVEQLQRRGPTGPPGDGTTPSPPRSAVVELKPGDLMPEAELLTEYGTRRQLSDFRSQVVAFTFFFTSCPLPDYCPRMNQDFAATRALLRAAPQAPTNWQFLSISFDPGFDTPEILSGYARLYRGADTNQWLFAALPTNTLDAIAPRLNLMILRAGGGISHNLRTVVLDPQGRIYQLFDGNEWTPRQLADAMLAAARAR
jgi:protein SCO1/2